MKAAICYCSRHHGNTQKVVEAMAEGQELDLIDVRRRAAVRLEDYDLIGFASGIYGFAFDPAVLQFAQQYLPEGRDVFFVYTYGAKQGDYTKAIARIAYEKGANILGWFSCRGYNTFGPFKLIGGSAKGHPDAEDLKRAREFYARLAHGGSGKS